MLILKMMNPTLLKLKTFKFILNGFLIGILSQSFSSFAGQSPPISSFLKAQLGSYYEVNENAVNIYCNVIRHYDFQIKNPTHSPFGELLAQINGDPNSLITCYSINTLDSLPIENVESPQETKKITCNLKSNPDQKLTIAVGSENAEISIHAKTQRNSSRHTQKYDKNCHFLSLVKEDYGVDGQLKGIASTSAKEILSSQNALRPKSQASVNFINQNESVKSISEIIDLIDRVNFSHLTPLGDFYKEECLSGIVEYVKDIDERNNRFKVEIVNGLFMKDNKPFTSPSTQLSSDLITNSIFAVDSEKNLYVGMHILKARPPASARFYHSSFLGGQPVSTAGEIIIEDGKLRFISNKSGHYKPSSESLYAYLKFLRSKKVNLDGVQVKVEKAPPSH